MNKQFNHILKNVTTILGNKETSNVQLDNICFKLFGSQFVGTFPSDKISTLTKKKNMCILNLDSSDQSGSHWISCVLENGIVYVYDSFDRPSSKIIPSLFKKYKTVKNTDRTLVSKPIRQKDYQDTCGQRCISALIIYKTNGLESYKML